MDRSPCVGDRVRALKTGIVEGIVTRIDPEGAVQISHTATSHGFSWLMSHEVEVIPMQRGHLIGTMFPGCPDCGEPVALYRQEYPDATAELLRRGCPNGCDEVPDYV